jgi:hypothetical protein
LLLSPSCVYDELAMVIRPGSSSGNRFGLGLVPVDRFKRLQGVLGEVPGQWMRETWFA